LESRSCPRGCFGPLQGFFAIGKPLYHRLIENFRVLTSIAVVINTSVNKNEDVVSKPHETFDCFLRMKMDGLVIDHIAAHMLNSTRGLQAQRNVKDN
jgi:hypothetical protein